MPKSVLILLTFIISSVSVQQVFAASNKPLTGADDSLQVDDASVKLNQPEPTDNTEVDADQKTLDSIDPNLNSATFEWIETQQITWSQNISAIGGYLDSFMGDNTGYQDINKSFIKLYFDLDTSKYDGVSFEPKIKVSLDLPVTKEKLRLVIENDPDQELGIKERNLSDLPSTNREANDGFYGAIRYLFESKKWSRLSLDWGVKARWPPDPFARFRAVRGWDLNENWGMVYSQEVFIFESKGFGAYSQFDFNRRLSEKLLFRVTSVVDWHERTEQFDFLEQISLFQDINNKRAIQYAAGIVAEEKSGSRITNYYTKAAYRRRLYKDWLFYEMTPGIEFQRIENFDPNPFVSFRLEMLFAKDASRKLTTRLY
ncbi:hypothetical protein [Alkalimarinus alittae]|uniref:Uncharacterized protein n=1 Tax=Alkalimarinus alittae TaxID=2961619 RepID=A0ABY6N2Z6_9ALTE|nr:hypothetical protein [Alkalimarinus alittae]UZE96485.1 hypothetical protein NKI27_01680 [Alkalimarinus alittae]